MKNSGSPLAMREEGDSCGQDQAEAEFGLGVRPRPSQERRYAMHWYRKATAQNDPAAEYLIGSMYENGPAYLRT